MFVRSITSAASLVSKVVVLFIFILQINSIIHFKLFITLSKLKFGKLKQQEEFIFIVKYFDNFKYHADISFANNFHFSFFIYSGHSREIGK